MNINQLMKQAQVMQKKMKELQEEIAKKEFEGKLIINLFSNHSDSIIPSWPT